MTNVFQKPFEESVQLEPTTRSSHRLLILFGIACLALCALYVISTRVVEASDYALRSAAHTHDNLTKQYADLGMQLDSFRSLSVISQAPALAGFQEVQKPMYLNMDEAQTVAVAGMNRAQ